MRVYIDSDILIWHLRGEKKAASLLRGLANTADLKEAKVLLEELEE
jgi:hypothetical protein